MNDLILIDRCTKTVYDEVAQSIRNGSPTSVSLLRQNIRIYINVRKSNDEFMTYSEFIQELNTLKNKASNRLLEMISEIFVSDRVLEFRHTSFLGLAKIFKNSSLTKFKEELTNEDLETINTIKSIAPKRFTYRGVAITNSKVFFMERYRPIGYSKTNFQENEDAIFRYLKSVSDLEYLRALITEQTMAQL